MNEKQITNQENQQLENLIDELSLNIESPGIPLDSPVRSLFATTNFADIINECTETAQKIVTNAALFYIDQIDISNNAYVLDKISMDTMELSNLLFQSKSAQTSYVKLLEEIDGGNVHPRIFEVQSALQKSMMEITKAKTTYIQIMEKSWRDIKMELQITGKLTEVAESEDISGTRSKGTKNMLKDIQAEIRSENPDKQLF